MTLLSEPQASALQTLLPSISTECLTEALFMLEAELSNRTDSNVIFSIWQTEDVQQQRPDLTEEQCREVLHRIHQQHNAEVGINWDVIDVVADILFPAPDNLPELRENAAG